MSKFLSYLFALFVISNLAFAQGQPGEEGPPYYGLELPPYGSGREAFEAFEKEVEQRKREQPGYFPPPYENALKVINHGPSFHEGVVLSYDEQSIKELKELAIEFEDRKYRSNRMSAIHALGIIHSVDPQAVSYDYLKGYIEDIETSSELSSAQKVTLLGGAYMAMSYSQNADVYDFLTKRAKAEFWGDDMPSVRSVPTHAPEGYDGYMVTAQGELISKLSSLRDPRLSNFLDQLAKATQQEQEEVHWAIGAARNTARANNLRALREAAYAKRLASLGLANEVEEPAVEIPATPPAPEVEEEAQESTTPEPATEKSDEVKTPDTPKEPVEQSSNWWLWLIGAVVVFGGIALVVRRKS